MQFWLPSAKLLSHGHLLHGFRTVKNRRTEKIEPNRLGTERRTGTGTVPPLFLIHYCPRDGCDIRQHKSKEFLLSERSEVSRVPPFLNLIVGVLSAFSRASHSDKCDWRTRDFVVMMVTNGIEFAVDMHSWFSSFSQELNGGDVKKFVRGHT